MLYSLRIYRQKHTIDRRFELAEFKNEMVYHRYGEKIQEMVSRKISPYTTIITIIRSTTMNTFFLQGATTAKAKGDGIKHSILTMVFLSEIPCGLPRQTKPTTGLTISLTSTLLKGDMRHV